jgi:hypothetical protein
MKVQIIETDGDELVVMSRRDYDELVKRAGSGDEDVGTARIVRTSTAALEAGQDLELPSNLAEAIARGENALRAVRQWRGMTQIELGEERTSIGQSTISALENGTRRGTPAMWKQLAEVLQVPMEMLIPD